MVQGSSRLFLVWKSGSVSAPMCRQCLVRDALPWCRGSALQAGLHVNPLGSVGKRPPPPGLARRLTRGSGFQRAGQPLRFACDTCQSHQFWGGFQSRLQKPGLISSHGGGQWFEGEFPKVRGSRAWTVSRSDNANGLRADFLKPSPTARSGPHSHEVPLETI